MKDRDYETPCSQFFSRHFFNYFIS